MNQARAVQKHLHLGVIAGGRFLQEKLITDARPVTVGSAKTSVVALPASEQLPLSVRSNIIGGWDWTYSGALAVSSLIFGLFILHVSRIPVPEEVTFDQIEDRFAKMIMPKKMEEKPVEKAATDKPSEAAKE